MSETLWITIPTNEENKLKNIISLISSKNLTNLNIKQLIGKLENNQAADWIEVLAQYNAIPSVKNINTSEMLNRAESVRDKFGERGFPNLKDRQFEPRELLSLVILCYSNPNLIGPKLCKALNDNNETNVKKEILENSSYVSAQNRVVPWTLNLRLVNYALYANDTSVRLPVEVINRVKSETIQNGRTVHIVDQRGGFDEWVNGTERASRAKRSNVSELDSYSILQSLQSGEHDITGQIHSESQLDLPASASQIGYSGNGSEPVTEVLPLHATNNAASAINNENLAIAGLVGFHIFRNLPVVSPVMSNIGKDLKRAGQYVGSLFSRNIESEQQEETSLLSPTARS